MPVLLLNTGSSSLKRTLLDSTTRSLVGWTCSDQRSSRAGGRLGVSDEMREVLA